MAWYPDVMKFNYEGKPHATSMGASSIVNEPEILGMHFGSQVTLKVFGLMIDQVPHLLLGHVSIILRIIIYQKKFSFVLLPLVCPLWSLK